MSRELRRVPLDFDWPLDKVWEGYLNPHFKRCPEENKTCFHGETAARKWFTKAVEFLMMAGGQAHEAAGGVTTESAAERGTIFPHPYLRECNYSPRYDLTKAEYEFIRSLPPIIAAQEYRKHQERLLPLTKELAELTDKFAGERRLDGKHFLGGGYSSTGGNWYAMKTILQAVGVDPETWGFCPVCGGEDVDPAVKDAYEKWKKTEPPEGPGYQVWETVSEGSPISPVFSTPEALIDWLCAPGKERRQGYSREAAEAFVKGSGWAPSAVMVEGRMYEGIEAAPLLKKDG